MSSIIIIYHYYILYIIYYYYYYSSSFLLEGILKSFLLAPVSIVLVISFVSFFHLTFIWQYSIKTVSKLQVKFNKAFRSLYGDIGQNAVITLWS